MTNTHDHVFQPGELVYIDSFCGLIRAKILGRVEPFGFLGTSRGDRITVRVTANRRGFTRGEITSEDAGHVIPRHAVFTRNGQYRIRVHRPITDQLPQLDWRDETAAPHSGR